MAFCGNCGSEQANQVKFCASCGKAMKKSEKVKGIEPNPPSTIPTMPPAAGKKASRRNLIIGGSALVVVAAVVAIFTFGPKPLSLTRAEAELALMEPSDFSFEVDDADEPLSVMDEVSWIVFSSGSSDCTEDVEILSLVQDRGTLLASADLVGESLYFNQDIIEFESEEIPGEIISLINSGYDNTACDYDSDSVDTTMSDLGSSKEYLGVGPDTSAYFSQDSDWTDYAFLSSKSASVAVADGKYLVVIRMLGYDNSLSISEANEVLTDALKKLYN